MLEQIFKSKAFPVQESSTVLWRIFFFFSPPSTRRGEKHAAHKTTTVNAQRRQYIIHFFPGSCCSRCGFPCFNFLPRAVKKCEGFRARLLLLFSLFHSSVFTEFFFLRSCITTRASSESKSQHKKFWWVFVEQNNFRSALTNFSAPSTCVPKTPQELNWQNTIKKVNFLFLFRSASIEHEQQQTKPAILFNYFVVFPHARVVEMRMNMKNLAISTDRKKNEPEKNSAHKKVFIIAKHIERSVRWRKNVVEH